MPTRQPLSDLQPGEDAVIAAVDGPDGLRQRLSALGFRAGRAVRLLRRGAFSGPLHVRLGTTDVALRAAEATRIAVKPAATQPA